MNYLETLNKINPNKFIENAEKFESIFNEYFKEGVNLPLEAKYNFSLFLTIYPMTEKGYNLLSKLGSNASVGYLSKYLVKKSISVNVPLVLIDRYRFAKRNYDEMDKYTTIPERNRYKEELNNYTDILLEICFERGTRMGKLNNLLDG